MVLTGSSLPCGRILNVQVVLYIYFKCNFIWNYFFRNCFEYSIILPKIRKKCWENNIISLMKHSICYRISFIKWHYNRCGDDVDITEDTFLRFILSRVTSITKKIDSPLRLSIFSHCEVLFHIFLKSLILIVWVIVSIIICFSWVLITTLCHIFSPPSDW